MKKHAKAQKRDIRAIAEKRDADIDFSDAPPVLDWSDAEIGKFNPSKAQKRAMGNKELALRSKSTRQKRTS